MRQLKITKSITNRSSEALDKYLVEIGRVPMITVDEEIELAQAIRNGGKEGSSRPIFVSWYRLPSSINIRASVLPT